MNNLNDPDWNITQGAGGGDNSKWNYALLVHMLGLAAFGWFWSKESQKENHEARTKYDKTIKVIQDEYQQSLAANRKELDSLKEKCQRELMAIQALEQVEKKLMERQSVYCSHLLPREKRLKMEEDLLVMARNPSLARLGMNLGLKNIFENDHSCAGYRNTDKTKNGRLMWVYLKDWHRLVSLEKHQKAKVSQLGTQPSQK